MSPAAPPIPVLPDPLCPSGCRPLALVERGRLLGLAGETPGGPCPWCLASYRETLDPRGPTRPLVPRAGRRRPGGGHRIETGRWEEVIDRLAGVLSGRAETLLWIEPETRPDGLHDLPGRVAALGPRVHLVRVPEAGRRLARRLARRLPAGSFLDPAEARPGKGDVVLLWDVDEAGGWSWEAGWARAARERGAAVVELGPLGSAEPGVESVRLDPGWDGALALALAATERDPAPGGWSLRRVAAAAGAGERPLAELDRRLRGPGQVFLVPGTPLATAPGTTLAAFAVLVMARNLRVVLPPPPGRGGTAPGRSGHLVDEQSMDPLEVLERLVPGRTAVVLAEIDPLAFLPGAARLGAFLDASVLVVVFGARRGPVGRRADMILPGPGPLARGGVAWTSGGPWRGRAILAPRGEIEGERVTWRRVGHRLGAPSALFEDREDEPETLAAGWMGGGAAPERIEEEAARWRPDPSLVRGDRRGLVFVGRRLPPPGGGRPGVLIGPATARARRLRAGGVARIHAGDLRMEVGVEVDPRIPPGLAVYEALPSGGGPTPGVLAPPPWTIGAVAPFAGDLFPVSNGGQRLTGGNRS